MLNRWFGFGLMAGAAFAAAGCGLLTSAPVREIERSIPAIAALIDSECYEWRSFEWAREQYMLERWVCTGEITKASIGDCQSSVVGTQWEVRVPNASATIGVDYFFDETANPSLADISCGVTFPAELAGAGAAAVRQVAARRGLRGPFRPGEHGFSAPTVIQFWTDERNRPSVILYDDRVPDGRQGAKMVRLSPVVRPQPHYPGG